MAYSTTHPNCMTVTRRAGESLWEGVHWRRLSTEHVVIDGERFSVSEYDWTGGDQAPPCSIVRDIWDAEVEVPDDVIELYQLVNEDRDRDRDQTNDGAEVPLPYYGPEFDLFTDEARLRREDFADFEVSDVSYHTAV